MTVKRVLFVVALFIVPIVVFFQPKNTVAQDLPRSTTATHTVEIGPNNTIAYSPTVQTIDVNDTVNWNWNSTLTLHSTTSGSCSGFICTPDGKWDSGQHTAPNSFNLQFTTPGVYPYYCSFHLYTMQGTVIVIGKTFLPLIQK